MGYTHYYTPKTNYTAEQWKEFTAACKKLHANLPQKSKSAGGYHKDDPLEIAGGNGEGKPVFNKGMVWFNGKDDEKDLGHETFSILADPAQQEWSFCKTARKPYDLLVVACLIAAYQILNFRFASDGFNQDETCDDLQEGIDFYNEVLQPKEHVTQTTLRDQRREYYQLTR